MATNPTRPYSVLMGNPVIPASYDVVWSIVMGVGTLIWIGVVILAIWMATRVVRMRKEVEALRRELAQARGEAPLDPLGA